MDLYSINENKNSTVLLLEQNTFIPPIISSGRSVGSTKQEIERAKNINFRLSLQEA